MAALVGIVGGGVGLTAPTQAQMPSDIIPQIEALGRVVDPPNTAKIYAPLQEKEPYAGIKVKRDVSYGEHARNVVDIFAVENGAAGRPVLAGDLEELVASHVRLTGPRADLPPCPGEIVQAQHAGRQSTFIVRLPAQPAPPMAAPGWSAAPMTFDELTLAYLKSSARPRRTLEAAV